MTIVVRGHLNTYMYMYLSYDMYNEGVLHSTETVIILYYCDIMHLVVSIIVTFPGGGGVHVIWAGDIYNQGCTGYDFTVMTIVTGFIASTYKNHNHVHNIDDHESPGGSTCTCAYAC